VTDALYDYDPSFVNPSKWNPYFDACTSTGFGSGPASFDWALWQDGHEIDTAHGSYCKLPDFPSDPPDKRLDFPALGSYLVSLTVTNRAGQSASTMQEVTIRDLLVVSFGDSSASGEGNRDQQTGWEDRLCHRSRASGPALAAKRLEDADPKTSVTYLNLACSGASVTNGIIGPFYGQQRDPTDVVPLEPQVDALVRAICGGRPAWRCPPGQQRPVDILTINVGVNDLRFSDLLADCAEYHCLDHHWDTALPRDLTDILKHNYRAPSCKTAQQRFEEIDYGVDGRDTLFGAYKNNQAIQDANANCDPTTNHWGHSFEYIKDRLKDEGVKVAQTYMSTYPADIFSGVTPQQSETTSGCGLLFLVGENEAKFMTSWGYRLNDVIENEATRLGWYPVTGLPEAFQGHGYCAILDNKITCSPVGSVACPVPTREQVVDESWFVHWSESESTQNDKKGTLHPNLQGHTAWATRYLAAIAAPKPAPVPESTVQVHLWGFRVWMGGISPTGSNGRCNGNSVSGIPVKLTAAATLSEAGFNKPEATATYQVTVKPSDGQFQPSGWYQFPSNAVLTFPVSSVDKDLDVTVDSPTPVCTHPPGRGASPVTIDVHRVQQASGGRGLAGPFQLRSPTDNTGIEVSGCIDVAPAVPQLPNLHPGLLSSCQLVSRAP
jgi:PKD repeat protein